VWSHEGVVPNAVALARQLLKSFLDPFMRPVRAVRDLVTAYPDLALAVLAALLVTAVLTIRGSRLAAVALILISLVWLVVNRPFEGPTLVALSWSHGITAADLVSFAGLLIAAWRLGAAAVTLLR
jgi:hypothetical protein